MLAAHPLRSALWHQSSRSSNPKSPPPPPRGIIASPRLRSLCVNDYFSAFSTLLVSLTRQLCLGHDRGFAQNAAPARRTRRGGPRGFAFFAFVVASSNCDIRFCRWLSLAIEVPQPTSGTQVPPDKEPRSPAIPPCGASFCEWLHGLVVRTTSCTASTPRELAGLQWVPGNLLHVGYRFRTYSASASMSAQTSIPSRVANRGLR